MTVLASAALYDSLREPDAVRRQQAPRAASTEYSARAIGPGVSVAVASRVTSRPILRAATWTEGGVLSTMNGSLSRTASFACPPGFDGASLASTRTRYRPSGSMVESNAR
jgi:hypothetical protein